MNLLLRGVPAALRVQKASVGLFSLQSCHLQWMQQWQQLGRAACAGAHASTPQQCLHSWPQQQQYQQQQQQQQLQMPFSTGSSSSWRHAGVGAARPHSLHSSSLHSSSSSSLHDSSSSLPDSSSSGGGGAIATAAAPEGSLAAPPEPRGGARRRSRKRRPRQAAARPTRPQLNLEGLRTDLKQLRGLLRAPVFWNNLSSKIPSRKPAIKSPARHQWHYCAPDYDPMAPVPTRPLPPYAPLRAVGKRYRKIFMQTRPVHNRNRYWRLWQKNVATADQRWRMAWEQTMAKERRHEALVKRLSEGIIRQRAWELWQLQQRLGEAEEGADEEPQQQQLLQLGLAKQQQQQQGGVA